MHFSRLPHLPTRHQSDVGVGGGVLIAALIIDSLGNGLFLPLSLVFFLELTDIPLTELGVILTVANLATVPVPLLVGKLADRFGAVSMVVSAQVLQAIGFYTYAHVNDPFSVFLAVTLVAIGVRFFWSSVFTAIADYADSSTSSWTTDTWYSASNGARTAGLALGGLLTGVILADGRTGTYVAVAYGSAGCFAVAAVLIAVFVRVPRVHHPNEHDQTRGYRFVLADRPFLMLGLLNTVFALASLMLGLALPTVVDQALRGPAWLTAAVLTANAVLITLLAGPVGKRLPRYRRTRAMLVAAGLWSTWALGLAALGPASSTLLALALSVLTLLFTGAELLHAPASTALAAALAPADLRGRYLASFQYSFTFASIAAPAFFTTLFAANPAAPWLTLALLTAVSGAGVVRLERALPPSALQRVDTQ